MGLFDSLVYSARQTVTSSAKNMDCEGNYGKRIESDIKTDAFLQKDTKPYCITRKFSFNSFPSGLSQMRALKEADMNDPFAVAALCVVALYVCSNDMNSGVDILNYLKGSDELTPRGIEFLREHIAENGDRIALSYFEGASPENGFEPSRPYCIEICETDHSRDWTEEGYLSLCIRSAGADSMRSVTLRQKSLSDRWYLWEFSSLLSGIKVSK